MRKNRRFVAYGLAFVSLALFSYRRNTRETIHTIGSLSVKSRTDDTNLRYFDLIQQEQKRQPSLSDISHDHALKDRVLEKLQTTKFRYYVYDNANMTRYDIRQRAKNRQFTWRPAWGQRFKEFSVWEILYLEALESSPFRTYNASDADFVVIPIPWSALAVAGSPQDPALALNALFQEPLFQQEQPTQIPHVLLSFLEPMFNKPNFLISGPQYQVLLSKNLSVAHNCDHAIWERIPRKLLTEKGYWKEGFSHPKLHVRRGFSISWIGAITDEGPKTQPNKNHDGALRLSLEIFLYNKTLHFFYQTTEGTSINNSTQFRHGINNQLAELNDTVLLQPSSIGWGLPAEQWWHDFEEARFCLVIRGDNPASRSVWRSIGHGCIPVIVSDTMPYYSPAFRSLIDMQDYAVMVDEFAYLHSPAQTLNAAILNLTQSEIQSKIEGVTLMQQVLVPNHDKSLFVRAFGRETLMSFTDKYYQIQGTLYGEDFTVNNTSYYAYR